ncbi:MAG: MMPL family transporter [Planctomycetales bacterium]
MTVSLLSNLYRRYSVPLLWAIALSFPYFAYKAETIRCNNDIETWLPREAPARAAYEQFKKDFGVEEVIVIGVDSNSANDKLIEALASRLDHLPGLRKCWTPARLQGVMKQLGVSKEMADTRLTGLTAMPGGQLTSVLAVLSEQGLKNRAATVDAVKKELHYCQIHGDAACLSGAPVIVTELDRLGSRSANRKFFILTLLVSLGLLHYSIGHWGMAFSILGLTLWGINATTAIISLCGGETNFILGALPVMVMIFTLSVAIHFLSYYETARDEHAADPLGLALKQSWKPCFLSTLTTLIGLLSLNISNILPVTQFSYAAGLGSVLAMIVGQGFTPALLVIWPDVGLRAARHEKTFHRAAAYVVKRSKAVLILTTVMLAVTFIGICKLRSDINPVEFLPQAGKVRRDLRRIHQELTSIDSVELVVDFKDQKISFLEKLHKVREIEAKVRKHPEVRHTLSLGTFFPEEMPDNTIALIRMLKQAQGAQGGDSEFLTQGDRLWRISARVDAKNSDSKTVVVNDLKRMTAGDPVAVTGIMPLLSSAQREIFTGFWESFTGAFFTISIIMIISLKSLRAGLIAMIPNIVPIWIIFGIVGFLGVNVDISMMMTGSIALGISVDCTFHFMVWYRLNRQQGKSPSESAEAALQHTGEPMLDSTIVGSIGMLVLGLSNFAPTARFGYVMASLMIASLYGEVVLLPALLCISRRKKPVSTESTHDQKLPVPLTLPSPTQISGKVA